MPGGVDAPGKVAPRSKEPSQFWKLGRGQNDFNQGSLFLLIVQRIDFRGIQPAVQEQSIVWRQGEPRVQLAYRLAE